MAAEAIPIPPTLTGLAPLSDAQEGERSVEASAPLEGNQAAATADDFQQSANTTQGKETNPEEQSVKSPIQPHPNATADDTSNTFSGSRDHTASTGHTTDHVAGEGYSQRNKVPTVAGFRDEQAKLKQEAIERNDRAEKEAFDEEARQRQLAESKPDQSKTLNTSENGNSPKDEKTQKQNEKDDLMKRMAPDKREKPNHAIDKQGRRTVTDPVTGLPVTIEEGDKLGQQTMDMYDVDALDPEKGKRGPALTKPHQESGENPVDPKNTAPAPAFPGNILLQQFPPPIQDSSAAGYRESIDKVTIGVGAGLALIWTFTAFGNGIWSLLFRTFLIGSLGIGMFMLNGLTKKNIEHSFERIRIDMERQRGEKFSPPTPESVEWLNALIGTVWRLINPDMFIGTIDMVEDVMQASLPGLVDAVKISDFGQGSNPVRIISMRGLPDRPTDKDYPKEEWIDQGQKQSGKQSDAAARDQLSKTKEEQDLDEAGDYVNLEVAVAYQAKPGQNARQHNIHLLLEFFLGFYDWFNIPIPIWAQVEGFAATIRLRMQMVPDAPFIRNLTFTLMGVPKVDVSVQPMVKHFPNVLDLPIISGFVQSSIAAAAAEYVAPKSMTLNMAQMISGSGIKKDTKALGVLAVTVHYATNLSAQDSNGKSDPYIVLAYAKFGKPLYSTRIITGDLNPVWEETAFLLLSDDEVKAGEDLALMLWDSDKRSADDLIGRITVPVVDLMLKPNQVFERTDDLAGFQDADSMQGSLTWSIAFYDKAPFNKSLKRDVNYDLPPEIRNRPELQDNSTTAADTSAEADAMSTPPDPAFPAGVLSVIVHQVNNLERQNLKGASGSSREGAAGQDTDSPAEEGQNLPSSYAELVLNDELIYKSL